MNCVNWLVRLTINDVRGRDEGVNVNVHSCSLVTVLLIILPGSLKTLLFLFWPLWTFLRSTQCEVIWRVPFCHVKSQSCQVKTDRMHSSQIIRHATGLSFSFYALYRNELCSVFSRGCVFSVVHCATTAERWIRPSSSFYLSIWNSAVSCLVSLPILHASSFCSSGPKSFNKPQPHCVK